MTNRPDTPPSNRKIVNHDSETLHTIPAISLIIPTYNRGERLIVTLESLTRQTLTHDHWELIVVNNNSTDDTPRLFADFVSAHPELHSRMVDEPAQGVSAARNRGISESRGCVVVMIDDDEVAAANLLESYYEFFLAHPEIAAAGGKILPRYESAPPKWLSKYTSRPIAGTVDLGGEAKPFPTGKFFGGGNHAVRRSALEEYGAFDTALGRSGGQLLGGEEKDLYLRLTAAGEQIYYLPGALIYHIIDPARLTKDYFVALCYNIGVSERLRTKNISSGSYRIRLLKEAVKWGGALVLAAWYLIRFTPKKSKYLLIMRSQISRGLLSR